VTFAKGNSGRLDGDLNEWTARVLVDGGEACSETRSLYTTGC
jgi:hypothetical protein